MKFAASRRVGLLGLYAFVLLLLRKKDRLFIVFAKAEDASPVYQSFCFESFANETLSYTSCNIFENQTYGCFNPNILEHRNAVVYLDSPCCKVMDELLQLELNISSVGEENSHATDNDERGECGIESSKDEGLNCTASCYCNHEAGFGHKCRHCSAGSMAFVFIGMTIGTFAVLGNLAVIFVTSRNMYRNWSKFRARQRLTKILFFSLSVSDITVAISTLSLSCIFAHFLQKGPIISEYSYWLIPCDLLGAIYLIGSEQSVFTMLLITISRVIGITRPFWRMSIAPFVISLSLTWIISTLIAIYPLISSDEFITFTTQTDAPLLQVVCTEYVEYWSKFHYNIEAHFNVRKTHRFGYYHGHGLCMPRIFGKVNATSEEYPIKIYGLNITCFVLMAAGYILIYKIRRTSKSQVPTADSDEDSKLKRKILCILATDFLCWIPISVYGIHTFVNVEKAEEPYYEKLTYLTIFAVMPINSLLNPFIYSSAPEYIWRKIVAFMKRAKGTGSSNKGDTESNVTHSAHDVGIRMENNSGFHERNAHAQLRIAETRT